MDLEMKRNGTGMEIEIIISLVFNSSLRSDAQNLFIVTYRKDSRNSTKFSDTDSFDTAIFQDFPDHFCRI